MEAASADENGQTAESITTVVRAHIKPDKEQEYEQWLHGINEDSAQFAGFQGVTIFRPNDPSHRHPEYVIVVKFATYSDLRRWEVSPQFAEWQHRLVPLLVEDLAVDTLTGTEAWFTLPGHTVVVPPSQIQDGDRGVFGRCALRDDSYPVASAIPECGVAVSAVREAFLVGCHCFATSGYSD